MPSHSADSAPICTSITSLISYKAQRTVYNMNIRKTLNSVMFTPGHRGLFTRTRSICWAATERE